MKIKKRKNVRRGDKSFRSPTGDDIAFSVSLSLFILGVAIRFKGPLIMLISFTVLFTLVMTDKKNSIFIKVVTGISLFTLLAIT